MYILIIVFMTVAGDSGVSITSVGGFGSDALCNAAAKKMETDIDTSFFTSVRFSCVKAQ